MYAWVHLQLVQNEHRQSDRASCFYSESTPLLAFLAVVYALVIPRPLTILHALQSDPSSLWHILLCSLSWVHESRLQAGSPFVTEVLLLLLYMAFSKKLWVDGPYSLIERPSAIEW
ncbi:hypothetical protein K491DRAFT_689085 [Lophiostoma macrostomum CBS 122681]|uniref:Uncharacterized protein n=1 Tax=Lophiostoma macrostomum CBS 122681 TaxID=1314788 RepID=A0A6A6TLK8_9PLEO|nr:hypothetical protein K491DRAFT_689085 [Lophiostoma macrostomum CBS 122681]